MLKETIRMQSLFQGVDYRVARSRDELEQAYRLVYQEYFKQGYVDQGPSQIRLSLHNALPQATTFIALIDDQVTATATVIPDSVLGLPMDELYQEEMNVLRQNGQKKLCEVSMLASSSDLFGDKIPMMLNAKKMFLIFFLFKHIFDYLRTQVEMDYICITVNPKHAGTYDALFFQDIGGLKYYDKVNGAPAVAKYLDIRDASRRCEAAGCRGLQKMFFASDPVPPEKFSGKFNFTQEDLRYFFADQAHCFQGARPEEIAYLKQCYSGYDFSEIMSSCR